jgi:hypothetical protein
LFNTNVLTLSGSNSEKWNNSLFDKKLQSLSPSAKHPAGGFVKIVGILPTTNAKGKQEDTHLSHSRGANGPFRAVRLERGNGEQL